MSKHHAIYMRVSTKRQDTTSQEPDLKRWAASHEGDFFWYRDAYGVTPRNGQNCTLRVAVSEEMPHRSPADSGPFGDLPLAYALLG
jgi:hypothetical protein